MEQKRIWRKIEKYIGGIELKVQRRKPRSYGGNKE
jgi:hypothetical protein